MDFYTNNHPTFNPHQTYPCEIHETQHYTNYCSQLECLRPLCPHCVADHVEYHHNRNTKPMIDSLMTMQANCQKKLKAAYTSLEKETQKAQLKALTDPQQLLREGIADIQRVRDKVIKIVGQYFIGLEDAFRTKVAENQNVFQSSNFDDIVSQVGQLVSELRSLEDELRCPYSNSITAIKSILLLDLKSLMDKFKTDIKRTTQNLNLQNTNVYYDESRIYNFKAELERLVSFQRDNLYINDNMQNLQMNQVIIKVFLTLKLIQFLHMADMFGQTIKSTKNTQNYPKVSMNPNKSMQDTGFQNQIIPIQQPNYFYQQTQYQNLHYFANSQQQSCLFFVKLGINQWNFQKIEIDGDIQVPNFHKSIQIPNGDIYLVGGSQKNNMKMNVILKYGIQDLLKVYVTYDFENRILEKVGELIFPRSSHSLVYQHEAIYIINGLGDEQAVLNSVERFDLLSGTSKPVNSTQYPTFSQACCSYGENYIFKIGGKNSSQLLQFNIERYDCQQDIWEEIGQYFKILDPHIPENEIPHSFALLCNSGCAQISDYEIMIFGGYDDKQNGFKLSFVLTEMESNTFQIKNINKKPLPIGEGFQNSQAIIYYNCLYAVQTTNRDDQKKILQFNGLNWRIMN